MPQPCSPGEAACYEPEPRTTFPWYGNQIVGDCVFAADADWEIIALDVEPPEKEVITDYMEAADKVWTWEANGLDGITVSTGTPARGPEHLSQTPLETLLRKGTFPLAVIYYAPEDLWHNVVVDGFTGVGPIIVTWSRTMQLTWSEWESDAQFLLEPKVV